MEVIISKEYVYSLLENKRIQKATFAQKLGISRTNLDALLDSKKKDINVVIKMAEALGMTLQEFIGFSPCDFKIKGYVKVGEDLREIKTEEDWYRAENDSGVCAVPYYSGFDAACKEIDSFLTIAIKSSKNMSMMGRVNGEAVFSISVIDEDGTDDNNVTIKIGKLIVVSILSNNGISTRKYSTFEYAGDLAYMKDEIKAEIIDIFNNKMEYGKNVIL